MRHHNMTKKIDTGFIDKPHSFDELADLAGKYAGGDNDKLPQWKKDLFQFILHWTDSSDYLEVRTSGSTGMPKLMRHPKASMLASARMTCDFLRLQPDMNALLCLSTRNIAGMMMIVRAVERKMNIIAVPPDGHPLKHVSPDLPIHFGAMVPAQVYNCLRDRDSEYRKMNRLVEDATADCRIENLLVGGAPVSFPLQQEIRKLKNNVYSTFGMTETMSHVALCRLTGPDWSDQYTALEGITIATGEKGNLLLDVPFLENPHVVTNDMIEITGERTFRWLGRLDHVINSGGHKIYPEAVENAIAPLMNDRFNSPLSTQRYFIAGVPDEKLGERPVLVVEDFEERISRKVLVPVWLRDELSEVLKEHEVPREIWYVAGFIETPTGKIIRTESLKKA